MPFENDPCLGFQLGDLVRSKYNRLIRGSLQAVCHFNGINAVVGIVFTSNTMRFKDPETGMVMSTSYIPVLLTDLIKE